MNAPNSILDHALALAAENLPVFPLRESSKEPPREMHFKTEATCDPARIREWFSDGRANVGIYTGYLIAVDVDNKGNKRGDDTVLALELEGFDLPRTRTHGTPTGGRHLIYRVADPVRQGADVLGPGLDIRARGGYIVAPGSRVPAGIYTVLDNHPIVDAPAWLIERCGKGKTRDTTAAQAPAVVDIDRARQRATDYLLRDAPAAVEGSSGDQTTFRVACRLKDLGASENDAYALMLEHWNEQRCNPPWSPDDLRKKVANAYAYGAEPAGIAAPEVDFSPVPAAPPAPAALTSGTDVAIARTVLADLRATHGEVIHAEGSLWRYDGRRWVTIARDELRRVLHEYDGRNYGGGAVRLSKARIDSITHEMNAMASAPEFFSGAPVGINCSSGFITFSAGGTPALVPHHAEHRVRHVLPGTWQPDAAWQQPGSLLDRLMTGCFLDDPDHDEKVALLGEVFGAAALGCATKLLKPKAIVLHGQTAENGKSQILDAARGLLPPDAIAALPPGKFGDDRFMTQLVGKLLNATDELSSAQAIGSDGFKAVITGEPVTARDVYSPAVVFRPRALHLLATNRLPSFAGGFDRGVQRRLLVVTFNRTVPQEQRIEHIGARIAVEEADRLLAFAVEGAARLIRRRFFLEPDSSRAALHEWIFDADPVLAWITDRAEFAAGARLPKKTAYTDFKIWARAEGFDERRFPAVNNFVARILAQDGRIGSARNNKDGRYFIGLKLTETRDAA